MASAGIFRNFSLDIGIDLGTCNTLIFIRGKGIVLNEPSVIAVERGTDKVIAVGVEAKRMLQRAPGSIIVKRPLRDGVIADPDMTEKMIKYFTQKIFPTRWFRKPRMVIGVPTCATKVQLNAVCDCAYKAGAKSVETIWESLAAAIGADIAISEPDGHMIVDIGGGTSEISVISLNGMVATNAIRVGGDEFDMAIISHIKEKHSLIIGDQTAERLKIAIGNASPGIGIEKAEITGTDATTGLPKELEMDSEEIRIALQSPITRIISEIKKTLGQTPPELVSDIYRRGIVMSGGGSLLKGLPNLISKETGVPVILAERPLECVALGTGKFFDLMRGHERFNNTYDSLNE